MNLAALIDAHPADAVALLHQGRRVTYGELRSMVARSRGRLRDLGTQPGDRVALAMATNVRFVVSYLAVLGSGMVAVPLNPRSPTAELERELSVVEARILVAGPAAARAATDLDRSRVAHLETILVPPGVELDGAVVDADDDEIEPAPMTDVAPEDLAALLFTSGTAGSPKPAMLTHGNLVANLDQMAASPSRGIETGDVVLCPIPLFHILGLNAVLGPALRWGARLVLMERFDPAAALDMVASEKVTVMSGPPTMWSALAAVPEGAENALATVRRGFSGAAPLTRDVYDAIEERFGLSLTEGYGLTETSAVLTVGDETTPPGSVGRPLPGIRLRLVDRHGDDVYVGDEGEVLAQGPNIFAGYWNDDDATARAVDDEGWLHTGDLAVVDDVGQLRLVDRAKDMIVVSGFNVYPAEVEHVLMRHDSVASAGVVGVPHPHSGEAVRAYVVVEDGHVADEDDLIYFCGDQLAHYKCPVSVSIVDEIPRTVTGKVRRRDLRSA